ncbi:DUF2510 domain-containing protein, partial [Nocardiopsis sp. LOL_012]|uniref:DUF2510 domain-containing protein n=1 Tax=Nocardiopsis sp. LOL_012 TaxID=3345409 RepID=UPI003A8A873E
MGGSIEPGWYADPHGDDQALRWWNGGEWTRHTRSRSELQGAAASDEGAGPGHSDGQGPPPAEVEQSTVRLEPPAPTPVDDEPSTVRIDPTSLPGTTPPPAHEDETPTSDLSDTGATTRIPPTTPPPAPVDDEPSTVRIDPTSLPGTT